MGADGYYSAAPQGGWRAPGAPRPGSVPLRPLDLGDLMIGVARTLRYAWPAMVGLGLAAGLITGLIQVACVWNGPTHWVFGWFQWLVVPLLGGMISQLVMGAAATGVSRGVLGERSRLADCFSGLRGRIPTLLMTGFVTTGLGLLLTVATTVLFRLGRSLYPIGGLLVLVAMIGFVVGCAYLAVHLAFAPVVAVLEQSGWHRTLARSWQLAGLAPWRVLGVLLLTGMVAGAVALLPAYFLVATMSLAVARSSAAFGFGLASVPLISGIVWALAVPLASSSVTLLYIDLRMRHENLAPALAQAAAARRLQQ
ncbi:MAG: hypothetical protein LBH48_03145 [Bifidobacteriaceae bacterium]|jgi:hypothetical protein|nr:hypothetical protein [Bifidobacteriaceae bacterium]